MLGGVEAQQLVHPLFDGVRRRVANGLLQLHLLEQPPAARLLPPRAAAELGALLPQLTDQLQRQRPPGALVSAPSSPAPPQSMQSLCGVGAHTLHLHLHISADTSDTGGTQLRVRTSDPPPPLFFHTGRPKDSAYTRWHALL